MTPGDAQTPPPWPALGREQVVWRFSDLAHETLDPTTVARWEGRPYQAAVVPQIAHLDPRNALTPDAIEDIAEAQAEVRAFEKVQSAVKGTIARQEANREAALEAAH